MSLENIANRIIQLNENYYPTVSYFNNVLNIFIELGEEINPTDFANIIDDIVLDYYHFNGRHIYYNSSQHTINIRYRNAQ